MRIDRLMTLKIIMESVDDSDFDCGMWFGDKMCAAGHYIVGDSPYGLILTDREGEISINGVGYFVAIEHLGRHFGITRHESDILFGNREGRTRRDVLIDLEIILELI